MRGISFGNFLIAVAFIFIGGWLLATNMGFIDTSFGHLISVLIAAMIFIYGLWSIFKPLFRGRKPHWFMGIFGTVYGGLVLAGLLKYIDFDWGDFWKLWPLLFVYIGFEMLGGVRMSAKWDKKRYKKYVKEKYKSGKWKHDIPVPPKPPKMHGKGTSVFNIVKEYKFDQPNWQVEPLSLWSMVGDYEFDFTLGFIPDRETEIRLSGWIGDIDIVIPEDVAFMVRGEANITSIRIGDSDEQDGVGHRDIRYKTPNFDETTRRLVFDLDFKILDMRIDRV
ncbi:MAG: cell wall-active antibiotics response protein LiaF [Tuberibacillus sp.]